MTLLNYMVYCRSSKKTLLPWQIVSVHPPSHTYLSFFESEVKPKCPDGCQMSEVHVGKAKEALDHVDPSLTIADVTSVFGNFVKFTTETPEQDEVIIEVGITVQLSS